MKKALSYYEDRVNIPITNQCDWPWSAGLCLVLPCALWGLRDYLENDPDGEKWSYRDTELAFGLSHLTFTDGSEGISQRMLFLQSHIRDLEQSCRLNQPLDLVRRLNKIGVTVELAANYPWIYMTKVDSRPVQEKHLSEHKFTLALLPPTPNAPIVISDIGLTFRIIRKIHKTHKLAG